MYATRPGEPRDLQEIARIQAASPEASQWNVTEYLQQGFRIAESSGCVAGFLVFRSVADAEWEILNLAVSPDFRRRGVARGLMESLVEGIQGDVYLEVRESNTAARMFYNSMGFKEIAIRQKYYSRPDGNAESAIVMKFHSC